MMEQSELGADVAQVTGLAVRSLRRLPPQVMAIEHAIVELSDGSRVFAKCGGGETQVFQDAELPIYENMQSSFLPRFVGVARSDDRTTIVLEDLSDARWPPPWEAGTVSSAESALLEIHSTSPPHELPLAENSELRRYPTWEAAVLAAERVEPALGFPRGWLETWAPKLSELAREATVEGNALVHGDAHGGNFCAAGARGVWVDWSSAHIGSPEEDIAMFATSVAADGGPLLTLSGTALALVAFNSASWAARGGAPAPAWGPGIKAIEAHLLHGALRLLAPVLGRALIPTPPR